MNEVTSDDIARLEAKLEQVLERLGRGEAEPPRRTYTLEEAGKILEKSSYTLREWCRMGRVFAAKRRQPRGGGEVWVIGSDEIRRYRDEGLLPIDLRRNADSWADLTLHRTGS